MPCCPAHPRAGPEEGKPPLLRLHPHVPPWGHHQACSPGPGWASKEEGPGRHPLCITSRSRPGGTRGPEGQALPCPRRHRPRGCTPPREASHAGRGDLPGHPCPSPPLGAGGPPVRAGGHRSPGPSVFGGLEGIRHRPAGPRQPRCRHEHSGVPQGPGRAGRARRVEQAGGAATDSRRMSEKASGSASLGSGVSDQGPRAGLLSTEFPGRRDPTPRREPEGRAERAPRWPASEPVV